MIYLGSDENLNKSFIFKTDYSLRPAINTEVSSFPLVFLFDNKQHDGVHSLGILDSDDMIMQPLYSLS